MNPEPLMTAVEVATYINVHYDTVMRKVKAKAIPVAGKVGRSPRFRKTQIDSWLRNNKEAV